LYRLRFERAEEWFLTVLVPVKASVDQIKTRQTRRLRSRQVGEMLIEHTYVDRPASLETWIDHCAALAAEFKISALDVHKALFAQLPEVFGG
jgi:hypothetical protein